MLLTEPLLITLRTGPPKSGGPLAKHELEQIVMTELDRILEHKKRIEWCRGLPVSAANALLAAGADSKEKVRQFINDGGDLKKITGIGARLETKILKWLES